MLLSSKIFQKKTNSFRPKIAIILGSGLTNFFIDQQVLHSISYEELPDFPQPTVKGHAGKLVVGKVHNQDVVCLYGRSHIYEGHDPSMLSNPIRVLKDIGCELLIITNAAGSLMKDMPPGSLMLIKDHINWSGFNPLIGPNNDSYGTRFPDMSNVYDLDWREKIRSIAKEKKIKLHEGVYLGNKGPSFESAAEVQLMKKVGVDAVGMSTIPEVLVARHSGLKVLALSCITNLATGIAGGAHSLEEVYKKAGEAAEDMSDLVTEVLPKLT